MSDRVRDDLDHVQALAFPGSYNERELDDVISGMQRVVSDNRLPERDRAILNDDLSRLRDFRPPHDDWGGR